MSIVPGQFRVKFSETDQTFNGFSEDLQLVHGKDGGYYTPEVNQTGPSTIEFNFAPSEDDMPEVSPVEVTLPGGSGGTSDHAKLFNRDAENQHPITAITGLEDALADKLDADKLPDAVNDALEQAKESGEFDGAPGKDGKDGVGIQSVVQTTTSTEDSGTNVITVTKTDGSKSTFSVKNGGKGSTGAAGKDGKDGVSPHIGDNGNWFVGDTDTGVPASGSGGGTVDIESVDPERVIFSREMYSAYAIGNIKLENGRGKYADPGDSLVDVLDAIFDKESNPTTTQPSVSLTFSQAKAYEVGTKVTPSYSATLNPGSYTYGPATEITATKWEITDTASHTASTASGSFAEVEVADGISYKITAKATYGDGTVPVTNKGNPYPSGQIKSGTKSATSGAITGYRNTFYGTLPTKGTLNSGVIRVLTASGKALANGNSFTIDIPVGALRVVFAYPATLRDVTSVKDVNGMNAEIASSFVKQTISVYGANSYKAIDYKVYVLDYAEANGTANKYTVTI